MLFTTPSTSRQILSVTKLNRLARTILEGEIGLIWLSAEVSNFVCAASGHWYFTLKDNKAQVRAAMFKNTNRTVRQRPKEGDKVLVRASVGLYEPRGDYQLIVEHLESDGEGQLKQQFEALKQKLSAEGLFSSDTKQALPPFIRRIGIITSSTGAALHDALTVLKRRSPATQIIVYPSMVQGETAASQLITALDKANARQEVDVILLTRGGGSLEDLWCFNDERLAYAIWQSKLPVVSAVGHEIDVTIADFVADLRAPTPSAGAELLSMDSTTILDTIGQRINALNRAWLANFRQQHNKLSVLQQRLKACHPSNRLQTQSQHVDRLHLSLAHRMDTIISGKRRQHDQLTSRLYLNDPSTILNRLTDKRENLHYRLTSAMQKQLRNERQRLASTAQLLQSVSPLSTLARGYSITFRDKAPVTSVEQVHRDETLTTRVTDGEIVSQVIGTRRI
ncbi:exodeoxyribonuclease VII large subunit [Salinimonas sp. HHU 13199]|uniref:Exodeoxyribonuclease 7 large subunit n=1 Tax=Salinimonas profundi TaxID=2729140 RepID=A0ABR8LQR4_9ALTE|nr:exodeoxyribonuclease VII large subunit [Salinimonas profundi]MBD3587261.1 exodeoxyribonuclease VII large subunit [Salinimonas profundi]